MQSIAIILTDLENGRFGHRVSLRDELAGNTVLQHTLDRVARIDGIDAIVLLHPEEQSLAGAYVTPDNAPPIQTHAIQTRPGDAWLRGVIDSGRKWALTAWRGGIGGMIVYDELMPAYSILQAMRRDQAESVVVLRADWCCIDPDLATRQLRLHRSAPDAMKLTFTQAPPGLSPLVIHRSVLEDMAEHSATVANLLCYNPKKPAIDPVGKDVNVPIPAEVRDQFRRFIYDTPRAIDHLRAIADELGDGFATADASAITDASRAVETRQPWRQFERLPQQITVELSPRRAADGPIVPQHHLDLPRRDMSPATIDALLEQLPSVGDASVLFGGLGDTLLHDDWFDTLQRATQSGLLGVGIETDLLLDDDAIDRLATLPIDVISVRLNADSAKTYEMLMGVDAYGDVMDRLQRLFTQRNANRQENKGFQGWVVPRLVKVAENLADLETFFERWMTVSGWAVVDRALTGRGLIPDMSPVPMEVPRPPDRPIELSRQKHRLTILSDGTACLCGQDWLGRCALGSLNDASLGELWRDAPKLSGSPERWSAVCPACGEWLEAQRQLMSPV
ncbi:MAG: hypothetical protein ACE37H_10350 [Phycisphaeraceae bacterium]